MIKKEELEKIIFYILCSIIIGLPTIKLLSYVLYLNNIIGSSFTLNQVYLLWFIIPVLLILYLICILTKKFKITYADLIIYILIFLAIISTIFAVDINLSIFGEEYRYEGLLSIICYYLLFLNAKNISNDKYKNNIVLIFLIVGIIQVLYGLLQVYTNLSFIRHFSLPYMAMALCGNPNFFGSYIIMHLLISISYYLIEDKKRYLMFSILFFIGLCIASSTGPFIGFILAFIFMIICFRKKINFKNVIIIILSFLIIFFTNDYLIKKKHFYIERSYNIKDEITDTISGQKDQNNIASGRVVVWKNSLPLVKKYWLVGAGLDNFKEVYPYNTRYVTYDKAHNTYLQMSITNGLIALLFYCVLCLILFIKGLKFKDTLSIALYMAFVGYSIQAFANISVIDVAPCFYIILGMLYANKELYTKKATY